MTYELYNINLLYRILFTLCLIHNSKCIMKIVVKYLVTISGKLKKSVNNIPLQCCSLTHSVDTNRLISKCCRHPNTALYLTVRSNCVYMLLLYIKKYL